ncbi:hypothetical protein SAMN04488112_10548 [Melghirimyces thermohalophilus]|uniref:Uncharacterized protein n=1 Tax=Melghirimyces thermohalophilus TaxID=1236220 RepID=A0A1G6K320_9BACL|nr:hypothetical protein SAMN04488112_10548 [Melghirimyces thermohalophilus]
MKSSRRVKRGDCVGVLFRDDNGRVRVRNGVLLRRRRRRSLRLRRLNRSGKIVVSRIPKNRVIRLRKLDN